MGRKVDSEEIKEIGEIWLSLKKGIGNESLNIQARFRQHHTREDAEPRSLIIRLVDQKSMLKSFVNREMREVLECMESRLN